MTARLAKAGSAWLSGSVVSRRSSMLAACVHRCVHRRMSPKPVVSTDDTRSMDEGMTRPLSAEEGDASLTNVSSDETRVQEMLARFGPKPHTFTDTDRAKAVAVRRQKAAERRERAMSFPEFAREQVESNPARWFEPYEKARADGEWRAPEALMDRIYGRPKQAVHVNTGIDVSTLEPGERAELRELVLRRLEIHAAERAEPDEA